MITNVTVVNPNLQTRIGQTKLEFKAGVNIVCGSNGSGKSTLLNAIMSGIAGSADVRLIRDPSVPVTRYSGEEATVKLSAQPDDDGDITNRHQSHGQGLRQYLKVLANIEGEHVVILDEPETALDFMAVHDLCAAIAKKGDDIQFIISTHHPLFYTMKAANFVNLDREQKNYHMDVIRKLRRRVSETAVANAKATKAKRKSKKTPIS